MSRIASFVLPATADRTDVLGKLVRFAHQLGSQNRWRVTIEPYKKTRSSSQNRYLNGVAYKLLSDATGYERDDISQYCCGTYFGWKQVKCPKTPSNPSGVQDVPVRTTTTNDLGHRAVLSTAEFADYVEWIQRFAAEKGILIPDPGEESE